MPSVIMGDRIFEAVAERAMHVAKRS